MCCLEVFQGSRLIGDAPRLIPLNPGRCADAETLSLLTSRRVPNPSTSHSGPSQGPSSAPSGIRPAEPVQHASHVSHGCNVPVQHDIDAQNAPSQAATKKRPLPQSFKPVSRSGFKPPRANYAAGQPSSNGVKPSPPLNRQLAPSNSSWPLAQRSTNQQQSAAHQAKAAALSPASKQTPQANRASHSNAAKQAPQPNTGKAADHFLFPGRDVCHAPACAELFAMAACPEPLQLH